MQVLLHALDNIKEQSLPAFVIVSNKKLGTGGNSSYNAIKMLFILIMSLRNKSF